MSFKSTKPRSHGFSLIELLATVAVIGVMGSIAVASLGNQTETVTENRNMRNAQEMAAISAMAHAAGLDFVAGDPIEDAVRRIIEGRAPATGPFKNRVFRVNLIGEAEVAGAIHYLKIQNGELVYDHDE